MSNVADRVNSVFRAFHSVALGVRRRTGIWTAPARVLRYAAEIKGHAPLKLHGVLDDIFFGSASMAQKSRGAIATAVAPSVKVPAFLVHGVQEHLTEFSHLYSLSRSEPNLYSYQMLKNLDSRWPVLVGELKRAGVPDEAVEQIERYMLERMNHLLAREDFPAGKAAIQAVKSTPGGRSAARAMWENADKWAHQDLTKRGLPALALEDGPFEDLDAFGKLIRLFPEGDPAWRELGEFAASNTKEASANMLQGIIGELIALRTPGVLAFVKQETKRILRENEALLEQGWRVMFQPRSVVVAKHAAGMETGGAVPTEGLPGSGLSFDFSVWLVKEDTAMPILRGQVKSGKEKYSVLGVTQSLTGDEWRGFSDFVDLMIDGKPKRLTLRPPDSYTVVRVLVVPKATSMEAIADAVPAGGVLDVFQLPMTASECGKLGGALHRVGAAAK